MDKKEFIRFINKENWTFAKTVPTWPHFYIVKERLENKTDFENAKSFIKENGYNGKFYSQKVKYLHIEDMTYWASPLSKSFENQNMINKCKTEYTYEYRLQNNTLPQDGFIESRISLERILKDEDFISLLNDQILSGCSTSGVMDKSERQHAVLNKYKDLIYILQYILNERYIKEQCVDEQLELLKSIISIQDRLI